MCFNYYPTVRDRPTSEAATNSKNTLTNKTQNPAKAKLKQSNPKKGEAETKKTKKKNTVEGQVNGPERHDHRKKKRLQNDTTIQDKQR
jgi:hypothetical protein